MDKAINWFQDKLGIWGMIFFISLGVLLILLFVKSLVTKYTSIDLNQGDPLVFFSFLPLSVLLLSLIIKMFIPPLRVLLGGIIDKYFLKMIVINFATVTLDSLINFVIKIMKNVSNKKS